MVKVLEGFDMRSTLDFYADNADVLAGRVHELTSGVSRRLGVRFSDPHHSSLSEEEMIAALSQFPATCDARTRLASIVGKSPLWFAKDATVANATTTNDRNAAMSPTCIVPSYVGYAKGDGVLDANVELYGFNETDVPREIARIVHLEGLIHEAVHALLAPGYHEIGYPSADPGQLLRFPDGRVHSVLDALDAYAKIVKGLPPISRYASAYHGYLEHEEPAKRFVAASEQLCEAVPALFLGHASNDDPSIAFDPLPAGSAQREFVEAFLRAEYVGPLAKEAAAS